MHRKSIIVLCAAIVISVGILFLVAQLRVDNRAETTSRNTNAAGMSVTGPYDFTEVATDLDMDTVEDATFVSVLISNADGRSTSYMVDSASEVARAIIEAVRDADEVDPVPATASSSRLTFALPSKRTLTFTLDVDAGLIFRQERAWRPNGDLKALVSDATTVPKS